MKALFYQTYIIALPIVLTALLGYIVWLLQEQKKQKAIDIKERNERIEEEKRLRQANGKGTMLLLRVQLIEYHDKYMKLGEIPSYAKYSMLKWTSFMGEQNISKDMNSSSNLI